MSAIVIKYAQLCAVCDTFPRVSCPQYLLRLVFIAMLQGRQDQLYFSDGKISSKRMNNLFRFPQEVAELGFELRW